jgi:deoxycytidylate deaminase
MRLYAFLALFAALAIAPVAQAQVHIPAGNPQTSAQPVFCVDPTSGVPAACSTGGGGGGGAVFGPTAVGSAVANPPVVNGFQTAGGNVAIVTPSTGLPVNIVAGGASGANIGATGSAVPASINYNGLNNAGTAIGEIGDATGRQIIAINSGAVASGAYASGAYASGAFAVGSGTDGWDVTLGSKADAATCATTNTLIACERQLHADVTASIPAGSNVIGGVTLASGAVASGAIASGAVASGAIASGAIASGALASGAISNGADVVEGNNTDAASCASATSLIACSRQLHTDATSAIPAGTNAIGSTGVAQASTTSGQVGELVQGAVTTANPAYTTAQTSPLSTTITGALRVVQAPGTMETATSGNVANATVAATLAASAGHTTYIAGFIMNSNGATAGTGVTCTLTGVITGTMSFTYDYGAIASITNAPLFVQFNPPIPASTTNTTIVASCPAGGTGATLASMNAWGFQQ